MNRDSSSQDLNDLEARIEKLERAGSARFRRGQEIEEMKFSLDQPKCKPNVAYGIFQCDSDE